MDLTGYLLGNRYEIIEKIGDGGMATVYKARCRLLNRYVAIKILKEEYINDADFSKKFSTEAQAAASLSHPNIVSIYDVGREGNISYIVMELVQGKTLKELIKEDGKMHWKKAVEIAYQIAQGIEHAHKNHIIHRDIKPHNIIVTDDMKIKVTDFGIAKAVTSSTITMSGDAIGSVHYFSPEQAKGGHTTEKSDIYSLGVVLYEMLTGVVPFTGESPVSIALKHVQERPVPPSDLEITVPYCVNNIVLKAMQKDPTLRYQTVSDMALDLSLALNDPTKNNVTIENYNESPTQRMEPIKENILLDDLMKNSNDVKNTRNNEIDKNVDNDNEIHKDRSKGNRFLKKNKKVILYTAIICAASIIFIGAFIGGLYLTRTKDVEVPDLRNMLLEDATKLLEENKLLIQVENELNDPTIPLGYIISQDPTPTMKTKQGNTVNVIVSKGPTEVTVPDLKNVDINNAKLQLEILGLKYVEEKEINLEIDNGKIIRQSPEAGTVVKAEETVTLYVSDGVGEGKIKMPKITEKTEADAKSILISSELKLKEPIVYKSDSNKPDGVVLSQSIPTGSIIDKGTTISIEVNKIQVEEQVKPISNSNVSYSNNQVAINLSNINNDENEIKIVNDKSVVLYDKTHTKSEGTVNVSVNVASSEYIEVYISGKLTARYII